MRSNYTCARSGPKHRPAAVDALFAGRDLPKSKPALDEVRAYIRGLERTASTVAGQNASLMWRHIDDLWNTLRVCRACGLGGLMCQVCEHNVVETNCSGTKDNS